MSIVRLRILAAAFALAVAIPAFAQERPGTAGTEQAEQRHGVLRLLPADAISDQEIEVGGSKLAYTATAGTLALYDQSGERSAAIFYTAYVAKRADTASRPITFAFNGGPGAASVFLHLGLVGPKIIDFGRDGRNGAQAGLRDNPETWLAFTDLVLIDPVGTGWSRPAKADDGGSFWGVARDTESLAKAIALYVTNNGRTASPKYLMGESYGGFRVAKLARTLQREQGIIAAGLVMVSPMLEGAFQFGGNRFALGAALHLPSLAATELERNHALTEDTLADAERFALNEYLRTLAGPPPEGEAARAFYARVAHMTGLPVDVVAQSRGFIRDAYVKHLREGKVVSRYDATVAIDDPFPESDAHRGPDPVLDGYVRALSSAFAGYARGQLGFKTEMTYTLLAGNISGRWDWRDGGGRSPPSVSDDLRVLLGLDPSFRVLIGHGYSDLVTPYAVSRYVIDHLQPGAAERVPLRLYSGGHMFYLVDASRKAFSADARVFYEQAR